MKVKVEMIIETEDFSAEEFKKVCLTCKQELPFSEFYLTTKHNKPYYMPHCRTCNNASQRQKTELKSIPFEDLPNEKWTKLFNGEYEFSNFNRVKSHKHPYVPQIVFPTLANNGYYAINFRINGKYIRKNIHRLVAELFIPNPNNYPTINHKNGIKTENRKENLEWCTYAYNNIHARRMGLNKGAHGEDTGFAKLKNVQVLEIFNSNKPGVQLSKEYNVSAHCISAIKTGERWSSVTGKKFIKKERHWIEYNGLKMILRDWAKVFKVHHSTLIERFNKKQPFNEIYNFYEKKYNGLQFNRA